MRLASSTSSTETSMELGLGCSSAPHDRASCGPESDVAGCCAMLSLSGAVSRLMSISGEKVLLKMPAENVLLEKCKQLDGGVEIRHSI